jgi:hypothetical protein
MAGRIAYYGGIVTNGLVLDLDAAKKDSYPGTGTIGYDISPIQTNCTLSTSGVSIDINPPSFSQTVTIPSVTTTRGLGQVGTVDFWFQTKVTAPAASTITLFGAFNSSLYIFKSNNFGDNTFWFISYGTFTGGYVGITNSPALVITPNVWYNFTISLSSTGQYGFYRNGVALASGTAPSFVSWNGFSGSYTFGNGLGAGNMVLGSMKMYNRFLSASEVLQNYNATKGRFGL